MAETQSRPLGSRGRGSYRGGRGGHSYRGGRGAIKSAKSDAENEVPESFEDQGEIGELKKKYAAKVPLIKEMFPDWTTEDIVFTLDEVNGDESAAIDRITEGSASQWGEVKKKHVDRSRSKVKEATTASTETSSATRGRGRGGVESRGRGRGDRGRGRGGRAGAQTNGTRNGEKGTKTADGWADGADTSATDDAGIAKAEDATTTEPVKAKEAPVEAPKAPAKPAWSSLFAKPPPVKAAPKPAAAAAPPPPPIEEPVPEPVVEAPVEPELPVTAPPEEPAPLEPAEPPVESQSEPTLTPSKDELTETNLEQLPDVSHPPETVTAASTVASTTDPHSQLTSAVPNVRPTSGYAASALKATVGGPRSASFQRRVLEQQEAVVMPGDRSVDRAAVQFGSLGLNGSAEDVEAEEDREEPETRAQPPNDSPVAPRASLPPAPAQPQQPAQPQASEPLSVARPAPGLPPAPQLQSPGQQASAFAEYGRYQPAQKAYDPFGQQPTPTQPQSQESFAAAQTHPQPTTSAPGDYSAYYSANQQRDAYNNNYYGNYIQGQDAQRTGSALGTSAAQEAPSQYGGSQTQSRYGQQDAPSSGHNTPNPTTQAQQQQQQPQQGQHLPHGQSAPGYPYAGYPGTGYGYPQYNQYATMHHNHQYGRNRPMFDDVRRYEDNVGYNNHHYGYGGAQQYGSYGKSSMYGGPTHHQYSYDHSSPAANPGFGPSSMSGRDSGYRTGSAQPSEGQQSSSTFGTISDPFGRSQSGFTGQQQSLGQQTTTEDASKSGPSPSLGQVNRADSNTTSISNQQGTQSSTFPPPQTQPGAFSGYQYGLGGPAAHQAGQTNYGSYGTGQQAFGGYGARNNQWSQYGYGGH